MVEMASIYEHAGEYEALHRVSALSTIMMPIQGRILCPRDRARNAC